MLLGFFNVPGRDYIYIYNFIHVYTNIYSFYLWNTYSMFDSLWPSYCLIFQPFLWYIFLLLFSFLIEGIPLFISWLCFWLLSILAEHTSRAFLEWKWVNHVLYQLPGNQPEAQPAISIRPLFVCHSWWRPVSWGSY